MRAVGRVFGDVFEFLWRLLKAFGTVIWRFMVIFSFIVNIILVVVLVIVGLLIFNIKNDVADPLLKGLHSSFVGLDRATIDWTIPVRDSVMAQFTLPLEQNTIVVLTQDVPLTVSADISGPVSITNATVALTLPAGTNLPVALDLDVPVDEVIPVNLDVRAVIPLADTQLHDPFQNLRYTFEPIILALDNLPGNFGEAFAFGSQTLVPGQQPDLFDLAGSEYLQNPWSGFSRTAGLGYELLDESRMLNTPGESPQALLSAQAAGGESPNVVNTGVVVPGGIPALDRFVRPELYDGDMSPADINDAARSELNQLNVPDGSYSGDFEALGIGGAMPPPSQPGDMSSSDVTINSAGELVPGTPQPAFEVQDGS